MFFFSGIYGSSGGGYDPVNDHAVRTHWFFFRREDARKSEQCQKFLNDLAIFGSPQFSEFTPEVQFRQHKSCPPTRRRHEHPHRLFREPA